MQLVQGFKEGGCSFIQMENVNSFILKTSLVFVSEEVDAWSLGVLACLHSSHMSS